MKLSAKGLALASGILWGVAMLLMGVANLTWGSYGQQFLQTMSSGLPDAACASRWKRARACASLATSSART
jgi:hypothetical protein